MPRIIYCMNCDERLIDDDFAYGFCPHCGDSLDWQDNILNNPHDAEYGDDDFLDPHDFQDK